MDLFTKIPQNFMGKWLNGIGTITSEVIGTKLGSSKYWLILYEVYFYHDNQPFYLVAMVTVDFKI